MELSRRATRRPPRPARAVGAVAAALVLAACSRGEGTADLNSAEAIAETFGCTGLEQVSALPHTPDEYTCTSTDHQVFIYRADASSADAVSAYLEETTDHTAARVTDDWFVTCADRATCRAIEHDLDVTFE